MTSSDTEIADPPKETSPRTRSLPAGTTLAMRKDGVRETIESVVIALVLAFLFRTFEAEAFVIPTGSMGPTLMGRHKDLECPECGYHFRVNAAREYDDRSGTFLPQHEIASITCPICRYTNEDVDYSKDPSFNGDRLLVSKMAYQVADPKRWDVIVFKYPEQAETNYIKRLVGLPGESIRIFQGDVYVKKRGEDEFHIVHKPADKARAVWQPVFDNDYAEQDLIEAGWPARWTDDDGGEGWIRSDDLKTFTLESGRGERRLTYRHCVPSYDDWREIKAGTWSNTASARPQLITDFCGYNAHELKSDHRRRPEAQLLGPHWVGDLAVEGTIDVTEVGRAGAVELELIKAGKRHTCTFDLSSGEVTLGAEGVDGFAPHASSSVKGVGRHEVTFGNIDHQLLVWVDGEVLAFDGSTVYGDRESTVAILPTPEDLDPVSVIGRDATLSLSHLRIFRDVYYIAEDTSTYYGHFLTDYTGSGNRLLAAGSEVWADVLASPERWGIFKGVRHVDFQLEDNQFFVLGDNSPRSQDSRLWRNQHYVEREMLIGKAMVVYWPHSWNEIPDTKIPFPLFPNFAAMRLVR